ncbi:MAG: DUF5615 family PIN-like protein [Rhodoplanes sp.]|uniref:DUF5615 family PIN-like protein n=1 Tax=Rhodoplanes sp. TaxID=1968906 RepID=UPI0017D47D2D|nr:DUF5615 family PIN-like protein [Rhodoplanes sp.]NVO14758.1 DUF5615 family PIN-like protein [Rhodoplanes sp.]
MRWLADECVDASLIVFLRQSGHDVLEVAEHVPGATDREVVRLAQSEQRLLLTEDKDFGDLVFRRANAVPGLVLLRIDPERRATKAARVRAALDLHGEKLFGRYTVIEDARIRSRPLRPIGGAD